MTLYIIGEDISAGASVVVSMLDGRLYSAGEHAGEYIGDAEETLRRGFRAIHSNGKVREDDG